MTGLDNGRSHLPMYVCWLLVCSPVLAQTGALPRLLPGDFRLTLKKEPQVSLPSIAGCRGVASQTIPCQVFSVTLENRSGHAVRVSGDNCNDPRVSFEVRPSTASGSWSSASGPKGVNCFTPTNLRLKPGETTRYVTRLIGPTRWGPSYPAAADGLFPPGSYALRATWILIGCTDASGADNCLTPRQNKPLSGFGAAQPVEVESNEIAVVSPTLRDLGPLKLAFNVIARSGPLPKDLPSDVKCKEESASTDCIMFHAEIRNHGSRALQWFTYTCGGLGIVPEYKTTTGNWKPLSIGFTDGGALVGNGVTRDRSYNCTSNVRISTPILPGEAVERDFTLSLVPPPFDTTPLHSPGEHHLRFVLYPHFCFASPDGSFCLKAPKEKEPIPTQKITIGTQ